MDLVTDGSSLQDRITHLHTQHLDKCPTRSFLWFTATTITPTPIRKVNLKGNRGFGLVFWLSQGRRYESKTLDSKTANWGRSIQSFHEELG